MGDFLQPLYDGLKMHASKAAESVGALAVPMWLCLTSPACWLQIPQILLETARLAAHAAYGLNPSWGGRLLEVADAKTKADADAEAEAKAKANAEAAAAAKAKANARWQEAIGRVRSSSEVRLLTTIKLLYAKEGRPSDGHRRAG